VYTSVFFSWSNKIRLLPGGPNHPSAPVSSRTIKQSTVEIVYNDIGYNDESDITTESWPKVWPALSIHTCKKIGCNDASITTKPLLTTQFWSFLIGYNDEVRRWRSNRALPSQTHIHRGRNGDTKEIRAYLNAAVHEGYTKQSKLTDYFTHK